MCFLKYVSSLMKVLFSNGGFVDRIFLNKQCFLLINTYVIIKNTLWDYLE